MKNDISYIIVTNLIDIIHLKMYYHTYKCSILYLSEFTGGHNMEQDLNKYIVNEFCKLQTDTEQRSFIENFRFLMMSNDFILLQICYISSTIFGCYPPSFNKTDTFFLTRSTTLQAEADCRIFLFLVNSDRIPCFQDYLK